VRVNGVRVNAAANLPLAYDLGIGWTYVDCCPLGSPTYKTFSDAWSIATLIKAAGASPQRTASVVIQDPGAPTPISLSPPDFDDTRPGGLDFPQDACTPPSPVPPTWTCPAFIYAYQPAPNTSLRFFRPIRTEPPSDDNDAQWIQSATGAGLSIDITAGTDLTVQSNADQTKVRTGDSVHLQASTTSPIVGEQLTYGWALSDGTSLAGAQVTHAFAHVGTYQAIATVTGDKGSGGSAAPITIVVGARPGPPGPGGGHQSGPPTPGGGNGTVGGSGSSSPTTTGPASATPTGGTTRGTTVGTPSSTPLTSPSVTPATVAAPRDLVHGRLLDGQATFDPLSGAAGSASAKQASGPGGTTRPQATRSWPIGPIGLSVALLALFLLGASSERPRRQIRPAPATPDVAEEPTP
jgi:hypothetical protein